MTIAWWCAFGLVAAVHLVACARGPERWRVATKPLLMPALLGVYVTGAPEVFAPLVVAIVAAWIGDVLLLWGDRRLVWGGVAFFVCHVCYIGTFLRDVRTVPGWAWASLVPYALVTGVLVVRLRPGLGARAQTVSLYLATLGTLGVIAFLRWAHLGTVPAALAWLGTLAFLVSDHVLMFDRFRRRLRRGNLVLMATYLAAQALIVGSFATAGR
ncbi:MAG: lysoplasmalogenase [Actinomycetia bacterium]|nr:lysoplasmalogenase [Actinomycetes bacterium]